MGHWIWTDTTFDNQTCRLWRFFEIPTGAVISHATVRISVDNGYKLLLDGQEIGQGSDWRCITVYDLTWMLPPGRHVLAVEAHNDTLLAGLNCSLDIELSDRDPIRIISDESWRIAPNTDSKWAKRKQAPDNWPKARIVEDQNYPPRDAWPKTFSKLPPLHPPIRYFWQAAWFQLTLATVCGVTTLTGIWLVTLLAAQTKAQRLLQQERVRIAQDIHDDIGSRVTELLLLSEVFRRERSADSTMDTQIHQICEQARDVSLALDEVVWAVNAKRDTLRDFTNYVCKYAQMFLKKSTIRCRLDVEENIPASALALPVRRNLLLAVKEALNNAAKHSQADELFLRIYRRDHKLFVEVVDNGRGFDALHTSGEGNGLSNLWQRLGGIDGTCEVVSEPGAGCQVVFSVPMPRERWRWWHLRRAKG
jgi:signal transduction histidine kinase